MKSITNLVCTLLLLSTLQLSAQEIPTVTQEAQLMSTGMHHAFVVAYPNTTTKVVESQWSKVLKSYRGKTKKNKAKELFTDNVSIRELSKNTIDVYAVVNENGSDKTSVLKVWFDLGGSFLNPTEHPVQSEAAEAILQKVSLRVGAVAAEGILDQEEDTLKDYKKALDKLAKEKEDGLKSIEDAKKLIAETEAMIKENEVAQENKKEEIKAQEEAVNMARKERAKYPKL